MLCLQRKGPLRNKRLFWSKTGLAHFTWYNYKSAKGKGTILFIVYCLYVVYWVGPMLYLVGPWNEFFLESAQICHICAFCCSCNENRTSLSKFSHGSLANVSAVTMIRWLRVTSRNQVSPSMCTLWLRTKRHCQERNTKGENQVEVGEWGRRGESPSLPV